MGGVHTEIVDAYSVVSRLAALRDNGFRHFVIEWISGTNRLQVKTWHRKRDRDKKLKSNYVSKIEKRNRYGH